jgi:hypothetical protein
VDWREIEKRYSGRSEGTITLTIISADGEGIVGEKR